MKRVLILSICVLTNSCYGGEHGEKLEPDGVQKFLTSLQELATDNGFSRQLACVESFLGSVSTSFRHKNTLVLANVYAMHSRDYIASKSSSLTDQEITMITNLITNIQERIVLIAKNQGIEIYAPSIVRVSDQGESSYFRFDSAHLTAHKIAFSMFGENAKENIIFERAKSIFRGRAQTLTTIIEESAGDIAEVIFHAPQTAHDLKVGIFLDRLEDFKEKGRLAQFIRVKNLKDRGIRKIEEIAKCLSDLRYILTNRSESSKALMY